MHTNPWYKATYRQKTFGKEITLDVPHDVFSTLRIDEGTLLLLEHLPKSAPRSVLDVGCGYGALSLPIAQHFPETQFHLIDRDLLAVEWSNLNAKKNGLLNVTAFGSLGYQNIEPEKKYDWILCNVPARIGKPFIQELLIAGKCKLTQDGDLRIVVITDLENTIREIQTESKLEISLIARGPRHTIFSLKGAQSPSHTESPDLYLRDTVTFNQLEFDRPFDLGGDDPKRLKSSLPLLVDALPRRDIPKRIFSFRNQYGIIPVLLRKRWPNAEITTAERDLLALDYTKRNTSRHQVDGPQLKILESHSIWNILETESPFDLILGEVSASAGEKVAKKEVESISKSLVSTGQGMVVCLDKLMKDWFKARSLISRDGFSIQTLRSSNKLKSLVKTNN